MLFYNNLYASYNIILKELKNFDPRYTSIFLVATCQLIHLLLLFRIIQNSTGIIIFPYRFSSKYNILLIAVPLIIILYVYYSNNRIEQILKQFEKKPKKEKLVWQIVSITLLLIPLILFLSLHR